MHTDKHGWKTSALSVFIRVHPGPNIVFTLNAYNPGFRLESTSATGW